MRTSFDCFYCQLQGTHCPYLNITVPATGVLCFVLLIVKPAVIGLQVFFVELLVCGGQREGGGKGGKGHVMDDNKTKIVQFSCQFCV